MTYDQYPPQIDEIPGVETSQDAFEPVAWTAPLPVAVAAPENGAQSPEPSISRQYREVMMDGISSYLRARDERAKEQADRHAQLTAITDKLGNLYTDPAYSYLHPDSLRVLAESEHDFRNFIDIDANTSAPDTAENRLQQLTANIPETDNNLAWAAKLTTAVAAASVRQYRGVDTHREYRAMLTPDVRDAVTRYLSRNLGVFQYQSVEDLSKSVLDAHGFTPDDLEAYGKLRELLPDENAQDLGTLSAPPLQLTQIAADIMNCNADSILPYGLQTKLPGKSRQPAGIKMIATAVVDAHAAYLMQRYGLDERPSQRVLGVLAECDLAERQGIMDASKDTQTRTANRVYDYCKIFSKVDRTQLPADAHAVFDHIAALHKHNILHVR